MINSFTSRTIYTPLLFLVRNGHRLRGKPPGVAKTLEQRLAIENASDYDTVSKVDIGFPYVRPSRSQELKERLTFLKTQKKNLNLEKLARTNNLHVNYNDSREEWLSTSGPFHIREIAKHYGIFEHLFGKYAYFTPRVALNINYSSTDNLYPVFYGNRLKPAETTDKPNISFNPKVSFGTDEKYEKNSLWTLVLSNPDGHLESDTSEYVHWMVSNISGNDINSGEELVPYMQAFPPKGTGYHRHVFILYKQNDHIDMSKFKVTNPHDLSKRSFSTYEFYKEYQHDITPAGLSFFQCDWDETVTDFYHNILNMKEPIYEYDFPLAYIKEQEQFPLKQAFNLYLDKYRDPKEVNKEYLEKRLAKTHPFNGPEPPLLFPNAHTIRNVPSWYRTELKKNRLGLGRINDAK